MENGRTALPWTTITSLNIPFAVSNIVLGDAGKGRMKTSAGHPGELPTWGEHRHKQNNKGLSVQVAGR